jgi:hypothetical protein
MGKTYFIDRERFIGWYFQDDDDIKSIGEKAVECLKADEDYNLSLESLFDEIDSIPSWIIKNWDSEFNGYIHDAKLDELPFDSWCNVEFVLEKVKEGVLA